jgi:hypothetical protein
MIPLLLALLLAQPAPTPAPGTPTPAPGTPTPAPGTPTPAPGTPTPAPGTPTASPAEPAPTEPPPLPPDAIRVNVTALAPSGRIEPAQAEVRLERIRKPRPGTDAAPTLIAAWTTTTSPSGEAAFVGLPAPGTAESDRIVARYAGLETSADLTPENSGRGTPVRLVVQRQSRDLTPLTLAMRVTLTPMDALFRVEHIIRFENSALTTLDTDDADGFILPLVAPAPFGDPDLGLLPGRPDPNELFFELQPEVGRITTERGRLVYRGPIPVDGLALRVVMALPYAKETAHDLGLSAAVPISRLSFAIEGPSHLAPRLSTSRPSELFVRPGETDSRTFSLRDPLPPGTPVILKIEGTPDRHGLMRPLVTGLSLAVLAVIALLLVASRRSGPPSPSSVTSSQPS